MKKITALFLALIMAFSVFSMLGYADGYPVTAYIADYDQVEDDCDRVIDWYEINGKYYFFIPASIDYETAKLYIPCSYYVDGVKYKEPETLATVFGDKTEVKIEADGWAYDVVIIKESKVASVFITTESGNLDYIHAEKGNEETGFIEIVDENGVAVYDGKLDTIKGRGNSTWQMEKKPYNIKLAKKTNLFGMGKSKKWSLIANHSDDSLMRNVLAYKAAQNAGMPYSPQFTPVDVYINHEYMGSYLLTTRVGIDGSSVDIDDLEEATEEVNEKDLDTYPRGGVYGKYSGLLENTMKWVEIPNNPADITGGYIIEMELANRYVDEVSGFVTSRSQPFTMKSPEYATKAQMEYISSYYQQFEDAVFDGKSIEEIGKFCNAKSLAQMYLINEWCSNMDASLTSTYFYKPVGDTLYAGPVWDFDIAFGNSDSNRYGNEYNNASKWVICYNRQYRNTIFGSWDIDEQPTVYNEITKNKGFQQLAKQVWDTEMKSAVESTVTWLKTEYYPAVEGSAIANAIRWNIFGTKNVGEIKTKFAAAVSEITTFATTKAGVITAGIGTVQTDAPETNFVLKIFKKVLVGVNDIFEKAVVLFGLENKE